MKNDIYKDELGNIRMKNIDVAQKFIKNIEKAFLKEFPKGECDAKIGRQNDYTKDITIFFFKDAIKIR